MTKVKWGIIGTGDIVRKRVAPALIELPTCEPIAVSRRRAGLAEAFALEFGVPKWHADWRDMLGDRDIDAVYIATPVHLHAEQAIAAAEAGKHVLCEKPMAMNAAECAGMIEACRANDVKLSVAYYRRFYPVLERVRQILASGEIGEPVFAQMNAFEYLDTPAGDERGWFLEKAKSGGGPMMDFGCHRLEVLTDLFGAVAEIESVTANVVFDREVEDTAAALLRFESGPCASVTVTHAAMEPQDTLEIFCQRGSIHIAVLNKGDLRLKTAAGEWTESHPPHFNIHLPLIADFAEAILHHREPRVGGDTGETIARLEDSIYNAGRQVS